jgi:hypothetical protein
LAGFLATMVVAAPVLLAADERSLFHIPGMEDFRVQSVERSESDWPFSVDRGQLVCGFMMGERVVFFVEQSEDEDARVAQVSVNPFDLGFGNMGDRGLVKSELTLERRIRAMASLLTVGQRLCDQPRGSVIGPGEL